MLTLKQRPLLITSIILLSGLILALGGCGNKKTTPAATELAPTKTACTLLPQSDAETVLKTTVTAANAPGSSNLTCTYTSTDGKQVVSLLERVSATSGVAGLAYNQSLGNAKTVAGVEPTILYDIGDRAYFAGGLLSQLHILQGSTWLIITTNTGTDDKNLAAAKQLAGLILAKL